MVKKAAIRCGILGLLLLISVLPVGAATEATLAGDWQSFCDAIPPEVAELLPSDFFERTPEEAGASVAEAGSLSAILRTVGRITGLAVRENLGLLATVGGILVLAAVLRAATEGRGGTTERAASFCTTLALMILILGRTGERITLISAYFNTLRAITAAIVPLMGTLYAMGGNITAAVVNHGVMSVFLAALEWVCGSTVMPVAGICLAMALLDAASDRAPLRSLTALIKRTYTLGLSFFMLLLCGVLGLQTTLAKGADTLALRTVRFAAGSFLPVVGGSISETLRTVSGSVTYLRGVVGMGGVVVIFLLFLPTFLSVIFTRITLQLGGAVAGMLSCRREEKLLGELGGIYGYFMAVIACLFVMTFFSLTLLARCATAV